MITQIQQTNVKNIFVTDWRYLSEYHSFGIMYGYENVHTIRINRPGVQLELDDNSETQLDDFKFNHVIDNIGNMVDYQLKMFDTIDKVTRW